MPKVALVDFLLVKAFSVPVRAHREMEYGEEFVEALPQEPEWLPRAFGRHLAQGDAGSHGHVPHPMRKSSPSESSGLFPGRLVDGLGITLPKGFSRGSCLFFGQRGK